MSTASVWLSTLLAGCVIRVNVALVLLVMLSANMETYKMEWNGNGSLFALVTVFPIICTMVITLTNQIVQIEVYISHIHLVGGVYLDTHSHLKLCTWRQHSHSSSSFTVWSEDKTITGRSQRLAICIVND
jgi:hypothetical protein